MGVLKHKYDLQSADFMAKPYETFASLRVEDPVLLQPGLDGETPCWHVSHFSMVEEILLDAETFTLDPRVLRGQPAAADSSDDPTNDLLENHLLKRDGEDHRRLKTLITKAFSPRIIRQMRPRIERIASGLVDSFRSDGTADLIEQFAQPLAVTVIADLIGISANDRKQFRQWTNDIFGLDATPAAERRFTQAALEFRDYITAAIQFRRQYPKDDLLSALSEAEEDGNRLSDKEMVSMIWLLIVAGHETSIHMIGTAMLKVLQNPALLVSLGQAPENTPRAIEEFLRFHSPLERAIIRFAARDLNFHGNDFKQGDEIIVLLGSANRDEAHFSEPAVCNIDRQPNDHLAFGRGLHYCVGAPLARLEGEIAINTLIEQLPNLALVNPETAPTWRLVPMLRGLKELHVRWNL